MTAGFLVRSQPSRDIEKSLKASGDDLLVAWKERARVDPDCILRHARDDRGLACTERGLELGDRSVRGIDAERPAGELYIGQRTAAGAPRVLGDPALPTRALSQHGMERLGPTL